MTLLSILAALAVAVAVYGPIPIPLDYFNFADKRVLFDVPHFGDVITNLAFIPPALLGLSRLGARDVDNRGLALALGVFFLAVFGATFGSAAFHLSPGVDTIMADRLPIALAAAAIFVVFVGDRSLLPAGACIWLLAASLAIAVAGVVHAAVTGDIRGFAFVQAAPVIAGLLYLMIGRNPAPLLSDGRVLAIIGCYALAKTVEIYDWQIAEALGVVTGHNLTHIFAAAAVACAIPPRKPA